jgi:general secretion pathway protein A
VLFLYTEFYNLAEKPFDLTHSSRYLYLGEGHKEALAMLTYGVIERKGFVLLTGEVGTGKTTILHALLADLDRSVQCVHLANPLLSPKEFMNYLTLSAFKNRIAFKSKAEFLLAFEAFLTRCSQQQKSFLLLVDEAHKLSYDLLEEIRLLSNMETAEEKLINIFLVGQPELNKKLSDPKCRALLQRISIRYQIKPLSPEGTEEYIVRRLKVAGATKPDSLFPKAVRKAIHEYSKGYPRMINILSDNLLLLGYAREQRKLTPAMVRECFEDLKLEQPAPVESIEPEPVMAKSKSEPRDSSRNGFLKWALIGLLAILLGVAAFFYGEEIRARVEKLVVSDPTPSVERPPIAEGGGGNKVVSSVAPSGSLEASLPDTEVSMTPPSGGFKKKR